MTDFAAQPSDGQTDNDGQINAVKSDLSAVLRSPEGRNVVLWFLGLCDVYGAVFAGEVREATDFNLGARNVGLRVIDMLDAVSPTTYPKLLLEAAEDKAAEQRKAEADARSQE